MKVLTEIKYTFLEISAFSQNNYFPQQFKTTVENSIISYSSTNKPRSFKIPDFNLRKAVDKYHKLTMQAKWWQWIISAKGEIFVKYFKEFRMFIPVGNLL